MFDGILSFSVKLLQIKICCLGSSPLQAATVTAVAKATETATKATVATKNACPANIGSCSLPPSSQAVIKPSLSKKKSSMVTNESDWYQQIFHSFNNKVDDDLGEKLECECIQPSVVWVLANDSCNVVNIFFMETLTCPFTTGSFN